jgi:adenosylcobyric acid synthase
LDALLAWAGLKTDAQFDYHALRDSELERLASMVEQHLDTHKLKQLLNLDT